MTSKREKLQYAYVFFADLLTMAVSVLLAWLITDGLFGVLIPYTSTDWLQTLCLLFVAFVVTFFFFDQDKNIVTRSENEEISLSLRFNIAFGLVYAGCMLLAKATMLDSRYFAVTVPAVNAVLLPFSHAILKRLLIRFQRSWGMETLVGKGTDSRFVINLSAGLTRIAILVGYMIAISFVPDIKRVFMYHGAEHKTVYCNEAGLELTPENARRFSRLHPRCGTAFLFLVMFISILIGAVADQVLFALFGIEKLTFLGRILRSLLTLPIVTGVSYEVLKGLAHAGDSVIVRILRWPGMMLQYLTTREPDDSMLEVAIESLKLVLPEEKGSDAW